MDYSNNLPPHVLSATSVAAPITLKGASLLTPSPLPLDQEPQGSRAEPYSSLYPPASSTVFIETPHRLDKLSKIE